jgi:predicted kinase
MLIGVPGSGKSTWLQNKDFTKDERATCILSTDNYIEDAAKVLGKTYNEVFEETIADATADLNAQLSWAVKNSMNIVWDQTNINKKTRAKKLAMIPSNDYEKIAVFFETPDEEEHQRRLNSCGREGKSIPEHVMRNMIKGLERPEKSEGFDRIVFIPNNEDGVIFLD